MWVGGVSALVVTRRAGGVDFHMPVCVLDTAPRAEVTCNSLVQTDNKLFNKVIIVFAFLCDEAAAMRERAQLLLPALLLLAEPPVDAVTGEPARPEAIAASALPLLFSVQQFIGRANSVAINLVHQLASLYEPKQRLFAATFRNPPESSSGSTIQWLPPSQAP